MSTWTHVTGAIRIDGGSNEDPMPYFGIMSAPGSGEYRFPGMCSTDHQAMMFEREHGTSLVSVPQGSEGSLRYMVTEYNTEPMPWVVVTIWGDLRDYTNIDEIVTWIKAHTETYMIRDGVISISCEDGRAVIMRSTDYDGGGWVVEPVAGAEIAGGSVG